MMSNSVGSPPRTRSAQVQGFYDDRSKTISYVVYERQGSSCALIDPVLDLDPRSGHISERTIDPLIDFVESHSLTVEWILETHIHHDHLSGGSCLKSRLGGQLGIGEHALVVGEVIRRAYNLPPETGADAFDHLFQDGEGFSIGGLQATVLHTPGHTIDSISYLIGDSVFVGDVLFMPDYGTGRCDFHGGDPRALYRSVQQLLSLPPRTRMFVCHDYRPGGRAPAWETTVAEQRTSNIHIGPATSEQDFVRLRTERDRTLDAPTLLLPSLQVNLRGGQLPRAEANGIAYLKVPINIPTGAV